MINFYVPITMLSDYVNIHKAISKIVHDKIPVETGMSYLLCVVGEPQRYTDFIQSCFRAYSAKQYDDKREEFKRVFVRETGSNLSLPTPDSYFSWTTICNNINDDYTMSNQYSSDALVQHINIVENVMHSDQTNYLPFLRQLALNDRARFALVFQKFFSYVMKIPINTIDELIQLFLVEADDRHDLLTNDLVRNITFQLKIFHPSQADGKIDWLRENIPEFNTPRARKVSLDDYIRNMSQTYGV